MRSNSLAALSRCSAGGGSFVTRANNVVRQFGADRCGLSPIERPDGSQSVVEGPASQIFHDQVRLARVGQAASIDRDDVVMVRHGAHRSAFTLEAQPSTFVERGHQYLDRDVTTELGLGAAVHDAETASTDFGQACYAVDLWKSAHAL